MTPIVPATPSVRRALRLAVTMLVGLLAIGCAPQESDEMASLHPGLDDWPQTRVEIVTDDQTHDLTAFVATTEEQRERGLQGVEHLPDGTGMLFVFDAETTSGLWMKDTLVPLEAAFVDAEGEVVEVLAMEPCREDPCEVYAPHRAYRAALEVPQGWLTERGVGPGARVVWGDAAAPTPG